MKTLIENGYVVTMDKGRATYERGYVAIGEDGRIEAVGDISRRPTTKAGLTIDASGMLVTPGLINTHTHPSQFLLRGAGSRWDGGEGELLAEVERSLNADDRAASARLYADHLIRTGTTCVLNHSLSQTTVSDAENSIAALEEAGLRQVFAKDFPNMDAAGDIESLVSAYNKPGSRVRIAIALNSKSPKSDGAAEALIEATYRLAKELDLQVSTRSSGDEHHESYLREAGQAGRSHVMHLMELGVLDRRWLVAMPTLVDETDIDLMAEAGCHVVYTPTHDAFRGLPAGPFANIARRINCALGSGGPLFDPAEDMVEQIKACSMIQNSARLDPTVMPFETSLEMATVNAAVALGLDGEIGSIEPGKRADISVFDLDRVYAQVSHKPISTFISTGRGADAQFVLVDGKLLLDNGQPASPDADAALRDAAAAARVRSSLSVFSSAAHHRAL